MSKVGAADRRYMSMALRLAATGRGSVHPNPLVGAVLVKNGRVIGKGAHLFFGGPHAEVNAIRNARVNVSGATLYVTLEPCNHTGKTPPCTDLIIRHKIRQVIIAMADPNPIVSGKGAERLKKAGLAVKMGILKEEAEELNKDYSHWMKTKMPYVTAKIAQSKDGYIAGDSKSPRWITGIPARRFGHRLRAASDAVMVGVGTVLADDPLLTARIAGVRRSAQPLRIIVDSGLRTPVNARLFSVRSRTAPICIATTRLAPRNRVRELSRKAEILIVKQKSGRVDLEDLLKSLGCRGIVSLLIEGGAEIWKDVFSRGFVNELYRFVSPKKLGGGVRVPVVVPAGVHAHRIRVGQDTLIHQRVK